MTIARDQIAACRAAFVAMLTELADTSDSAALGETLLELDALRAELGAVRDDAEQRLVAALGDCPEITVAGGTLTVRRSDSRKAWAHKDLAAEVARRIVQTNVDFETGEMLRGTEDLITDVLTYAGVSYWKVTALNNIGISADDFCEVTEGPMKVRIHRV